MSGLLYNSLKYYFYSGSSGEYTLCVYGANNDMVWGDKELRIKIFIHPPFYATGYAYLAYSILTVVLFVFYI